MKAGELYVSLGIKGADKASEQLKTINTSLKDTYSSALLAKAGIVAAVAGLLDMTRNVNQFATTMTGFGRLFELPLKQVQEWQYHFAQGNVTATETLGILDKIVGIQAKIALGKGFPAGMGVIAPKGGWTELQKTNPFEMLKVLREYLIRTRGQNIPGPTREFLSAFLGDKALEAMLHPKFMSPIPAINRPLSQGTLNTEDEMRRKLGNVEDAWGKELAKLNATFMPALINALQKLTETIIPLIELFRTSQGEGGFLNSLKQTLFPEENRTGRGILGPSPSEQLVNSIRNMHLEKLTLPEAFGMASSFVHNELKPVTNINIHGADLNNADSLGRTIDRHVTRANNNSFRPLPVNNGGK